MTETILTRRRALVRGTTAILAVSTAGCLDGSGSSDRATVTMTDDLSFDPETVRIEIDATVVWENTTSIDHTVTALEKTLPEKATYFASGGFDSECEARENPNAGLVELDGTYEHPFRHSGTYGYVCLPHERSGMTGTVVVTENEGSD
ncbi:MAG: plastocyanin/azurin family copper-binding protein [Halobacteriales archaeon]